MFTLSSLRNVGPRFSNYHRTSFTKDMCKAVYPLFFNWGITTQNVKGKVTSAYLERRSWPILVTTIIIIVIIFISTAATLKKYSHDNLTISIFNCKTSAVLVIIYTCETLKTYKLLKNKQPNRKFLIVFCNILNRF